MALRQVLAVALCIAINVIDGFDILCASFTGPAIAHDWALDPTRLGLVFSAAPLGMVAGALLLAPLADRWGRRRMMPFYLLLVTVGMMGAALAPDLRMLLIARVSTGLGVAAAMAAANTVVAEQANNRWRDLCLSLQAGGFPLGATAGAMGYFLLAGLGWRFMYVLGAGVSAVFILGILAWMPESVAFLCRRRPTGALEQVNRILTDVELRDRAPRPHGARMPAFGDLGFGTALICLAFFSLMFTFYFLTSWTPKLLTDYGLSAQMGVSGAVLMNLGGVAGDLVFAGLAGRWAAGRLGPLFMTACFVTAIGFAFLSGTLSALLPMTFLLGFLLFGSMACLYALVPSIFPAEIRTTGTGVAIGMGRIGATLGPYLGGVLIASAWTRPAYLLALSAPLLVCAAAALALQKRASGVRNVFDR
ncbi:MFS transporter [Phenylobacterium sp.]|uniref:MFS transporter n=1 Tax=Phenylobacterium sp. TaxID=1871053 RepID=UPI002E37DB20|nr:MFS transporter [Phenylobacterium sp.]HEX4709833.1 MFS transporter [Phenylobacterium sp.]